MAKTQTGLVHKPEVLTKDIAAARLNISVRRLMEISSEGKIRRHKVFDPTIGRETTMFAAADVDKLIRELTPAPAPEFPPMPESVKPRPWVNLETAAEITGLSARLLVGLIQAGKLAALDEHTPGHSRWRVHRRDLEAIAGETKVSESTAGGLQGEPGQV
jgi:hypothetical protein